MLLSRLAGLGLATCLVIVAPASATLIGVDWDDGKLYNVSTSDASLSLIGPTGITQLSALEYAPGGTLYAFSSGVQASLYTIDPVTATATLVGPLGMFAFEGGIAFSPDGTAYAVSGGSVAAAQLLQLNLATGAATVVATLSGGPHDVNGLAWRSDGKLIGLDRTSNGLIVIDPATGATSLLATVATDIGATGGMAAVGGTGYFSTSGQGDVIPGSNNLYSFDLFTGAYAVVGGFVPVTEGTGIGGLAMPIPEPSTLGMLLLSYALPWRRTPRRRVGA